ncbi:unnamed protein product [Rhizophagus irregularis]|nr:unnamed protein product [Rhizophagus irregularis]
MEVGDDDDGNEQDFENEVLPTVKSFKDKTLEKCLALLSVVEELSFIEFMHLFHPSALVSLADTIKRNIYNLYKVNVKKIKDILQMVPEKILFTTDIWTSLSTKSFLSLTAHFIDKEWKL